MNSSTPFPFVVGCGRSGTTLLRAMLDSHPELSIPHEAHFVAPMIQKRALYETAAGVDVNRFASDLLSVPAYSRWFSHWGMDESEVRDVVALPSRPIDIGEAFRRLYRGYTARLGKSRQGDKTPTNVLHIPILAAVFPESRFVHMIRDGRDVAVAYLDASFGPSSVWQAARHWRSRVERGRRGGQLVGTERYRELHYEDLVDDPESTLRDLCEFLELTFDDAMLRYADRAEALLKAGLQPEHHRHLFEPPGRVRDWRRDLSTRDVYVFEALAGSSLLEFGYELSGAQPTPGDRLAAGYGWLGWQLRRASKIPKRSHMWARRSFGVE